MGAFRIPVAFLLFLTLQPAAFPQDGPAIDTVLSELADDPNNPILSMQLRMLRHKAGTTNNDSQNFPRPWSQRVNNLQSELHGPVSFRQSGGLAGEADILTGQRAIEESLQLGSIGVNRADDDPEQTVSISTLTSLEIPSHPWQDMLEGNVPVVPDIAALIPKDTLFVHLNRPASFSELESILQEQSQALGDVYNLNFGVSMKSRMAKRLGIPDANALLGGVDELALLSEDLSFFPRTNYGLILKPKNILAEKGFDLLVDKDAIYKKIGDYLVVVTHTALLEKIERAYQTGSDSMSSELDYHYALIKMEPKRDGLAYLSEAFIRKLTGPGYRINARRRNTVMSALEALQYSVFAYRRIHGDWPTSLSVMMDQGYLAKDSVFDQGNYEITEDGRVVHQTWGSIWEVTPVSQVLIDTITVAEGDIYQRFTEGYQSFFREFFDPVGIAFTLSDQLYLHTLVLPLIENSDYRRLQSLFSGVTQQLSFVFEPSRPSAVTLAGSFSIDETLLQLRPPRTTEQAEKSREQRIFEAEQELAESITGQVLEPGERLLDFIGDEIMVGVGEENAFSVTNIANLDVWLGVAITDSEKARLFFRQVWQKFAQESRSSGFGSGVPGLQLSSTEPLSNEYNGQQFFILPTGFTNIFYVFLDDAFYLTISQVAMNRLIDAYQNPKGVELSADSKRGFAHIGKDHNIVAALDLEKVANFSIDSNIDLSARRLSSQFKRHRESLREAITLAEILPDYDGTVANAQSYYRFLPEDFYQSRLVTENGLVYLTAGDQKTDISQLEMSDREILEIILPAFSVDDYRARISSFRSATLGLSFLPEGLEVKMSFGNPMSSAVDPRFVYGETATRGSDETNYGVMVGILFGFTLLLLAIFLATRGRSQSS